jgi:S-DNA-T family DNA segregation ATPase FtsK/SpoIIIE
MQFMNQAKRVANPTSTLPLALRRILREGALYLVGALALYVTIALFTYSPNDPGWSHTGAGPVRNWGGRFGAWLADLLLHGFGHFAYLVPLALAVAAWRIYRDHGEPAFAWQRRLIAAAGVVLTVVGGCGLEAHHYASTGSGHAYLPGGVLGDVIARGLAGAVGQAGASVFLLAMFLAGVTFLTGLSWFSIMDRIGELICNAYDRTVQRAAGIFDRRVGRKAREQRDDSVKLIREKLEKKKPPRIEPRVAPVADSGRLEREKQVPLFEEPKRRGRSLLPPLNLLDAPEAKQAGYSKEALEAMSRLVEKKLADFNIDVQVVAVHPGPVITRFELDPAPGIKASQITTLARDLARALSTVSVRVVENIPGKATVGLEIPNEQRETVRLIEGLSSREYEEAGTPLALMLGKDIGGAPVIADLTKMPHLLIAGTTGSGKSVGLNAMVLSIVYKATPEQVRMIMVDPKMLELSVYEGIPHLLAPVVTDMRQAANALRWCIVEMERRYRLMAALGVRNIAGHNRRIEAGQKEGKPVFDPLAATPEEALPLPTLPYLVVVIDELADLMLVVGKKVEELITRLAQKGRASGLHMILATQRPSVDVITGLIKANIPARIAFQVAARVDSRTILDQMGAEQLLGHGDMLYLPPGTSVPIRVHGSFVSDQEVHKVAAHLKEAGVPAYDETVLTGPMERADGIGAGGGELEPASAEDDPLYDQALRFVTETRRASVSAVQRQLRVGYNRAARMIEAMEAVGVVGPLQGNGKREVLARPPAGS